MKAAAAKTVVTVDFAAATPQPPDVPPTGRVPRVTRMLALAHKIDRMVRNGQIADYADAARRLGLTRARVTQVMNLLLLSPEIQELILAGEMVMSERQARELVRVVSWAGQREWMEERGLL